MVEQDWNRKDSALDHPLRLEIVRGVTGTWTLLAQCVPRERVSQSQSGHENRWIQHVESALDLEPGKINGRIPQTTMMKPIGERPG